MLTHCKVGAIVFFVSDLARSVDFYRGTLGLPIDALDGHDGPWAMGDVGDLTLVFIPRPARAGGKGFHRRVAPGSVMVGEAARAIAALKR